MLGDFDDWFLRNCRCCACGGTLETGGRINIAVTEKLATWKCPVIGRFDVPDYGPRAIAIVCDECMQKNEDVRYCIELEGPPYRIIYHDVGSLADSNKSMAQMKYYFGRSFRRKMLLRAARQENGN